jgi:hypothetical protein
MMLMLMMVMYKIEDIYFFHNNIIKNQGCDTMLLMQNYHTLQGMMIDEYGARNSDD